MLRRTPLIHLVLGLLASQFVMLSVRGQQDAPEQAEAAAFERETGKRVYVYGNEDGDGRFVPSGWMPDGSGISLDASEKEFPHSKPACMRVRCNFSSSDWCGVYFLLNGKWEPEEAFDVAKELQAKPGDHIRCRFWARSADGATLQFKVGGVGNGAVKDSLRFPVATNWIKLDPRWKMYEIKLDGKDLRSVVGGFVWLADKSHNKREVVSFDLDDIYFVKTVPAPSQPPAASLRSATEKFYAKIQSLRWIAYTPSTFDPKSKEPMLRADIEADLRTLRAAGFTGVVTYSCSRVKSDAADDAGKTAGFADIPHIAKRLGFEGFIVGVWEPGDTDEIASAKQLVRDGVVDAVCVGNEGLDGRYDWDKLNRVMNDIRTSCNIPVSTTEQIEDYGFDSLHDGDSVDWIFPNIHPVFQNSEDPRKAAEWTVFMAKELRKLVDGDRKLPVLVKETGWPSQGMPYHNEKNQKLFWDTFDKLARDAELRYVLFEAFEQPWKHEHVLGKDIGPHWGIFTVDRKPKLFSRRKASQFDKP